jgi:hypothetical protein
VYNVYKKYTLGKKTHKQNQCKLVRRFSGGKEGTGQELWENNGMRKQSNC